MIFEVPRQHNNQMIKIPVRTWEPQRLIVRATNPNKANTVYFDAAPVIRGRDYITIKIPKMPPSVIVELYNDKMGNIAKDPTFAIGDVRMLPIKQNVGLTKIMDRNVGNFARFSDAFAENAGILSAQNSVYVSPDGKFRIDYKDVIRDDKGRPLRTPARIHSKTGIIEISKKYYVRMTVPGRKAINWHEFSHVFRNVNKADEIEADKNAITIYLLMGNPTGEAYKVFLKVFHNTPSNINRTRYNELKRFIRETSNKINKQPKQPNHA